MAESGADSAELVEFLAKAIVTDPDSVKVSDNGDNTLELETDSADRGRVIGRQGRVVKALRAVLAASPGSGGYHLEIVD